MNSKTSRHRYSLSRNKGILSCVRTVSRPRVTHNLLTYLLYSLTESNKSKTVDSKVVDDGVEDRTVFRVICVRV